jgi:hypothetical protein
MKATEGNQVSPQISAETADIVRQRLATLDHDKKTAKPWSEVKRRILERKPRS